MIDNKKSILYPKVLAKRHLLDYLEELNYGEFGGMGDKLPLSFKEIESFMWTTQTKLNRWEVLALRTLSYDYILQSQKKDFAEKPPYLEVSEGDYLKQTAVSANSIAMKFGISLSK